MKGVIFNLLEQVVSDQLGEETWDALLEAANVTGTYTAVGSYPHEEFATLVRAASGRLDKSTDDIERWFGRGAFPLLAQRYPSFFEQPHTTRSFLLTLNDVIHPEVRKLFPGAYAPTFRFDASNPETLGLAYQSHRNLCSFAEGLIEGAAAHFGEQVVVEHVECAKRGDAECMLRVKFSSS